MRYCSFSKKKVLLLTSLCCIPHVWLFALPLGFTEEPQQPPANIRNWSNDPTWQQNQMAILQGQQALQRNALQIQQTIQQTGQNIENNIESTTIVPNTMAVPVSATSPAVTPNNSPPTVTNTHGPVSPPPLPTGLAPPSGNNGTPNRSGWQYGF